MMNLRRNTIEDNQNEILELEAAMKETKNVRMYKRYSVVLKHFQGFQNKVIAEMEELEGFAMKKAPGAPRKLNTKQEQKLIHVIINNTPDEVGFESIKNWTIKLIGVLDYESGHVYCEEHEKYDAAVILEFLKKVLTQYPKGKIVIILENAKIHYAKLIQPFLVKVNNRLELMFLPPYSPDLNLIKR